MIHLENISKGFKTKKESVAALKNVSLQVHRGELFGLIGPDGAGKTTLMRLLTTLLIPDEGNARVAGFDTVRDFREIRKRVGYMPGKFSLYMDLTIEQNLHFFATVFNTTVEENYELIKDIYVQIEPFKKRRAGQLSGGMKQKLALCCALIHKPEVLFLDEPTTGVDAVSRMEFWVMLQQLKQQGITIFVSTPYMDEAGQCGRIALIQKGEILEVDSPEHITASFQHPLLEVKGKNMLALLHGLKEVEQTKDVYAFGEYHHVVLEKGGDVEHWKQNAQNRYGDLQISPVRSHIEDCFIYLMKNRKNG